MEISDQIFENIWSDSEDYLIYIEISYQNFKAVNKKI
jgi:hypothetical protein